MPCRVLIFSVLALSLISPVASATEPEPISGPISKASGQGEQAIGGFQVAEGLKVELVAAEPDVANPVAFDVAADGRIFVVESFRQNRGVTDNRGHDSKWLDDDLAAQTVEDRRAYHLKHLGKKAADYTKYDDRIRLLRDTDGDGQVDQARVFASGFNDLVAGSGAGVLARGNDVYFTCIPSLWRLQDEDGDGVSDARQPLHTGYGVRVAFRGHDLHGPILGPDGKLYYSIGDRGFNITTDDGRKLAHPNTGAVFRCSLDGSDLEVYCLGLRNPQELAFDDFGNLFTGDNNSDSGDKARIVHLLEGSDSGWRMEYQYLGDRGPWNREKLWHPAHPGQATYIVPPVTNFADGPSGFAFDPGTGLPEAHRGKFFLVDFRGGAGNSGVRTFRLKPKGAGFELTDSEQFLWRCLATDIQFGPDGAVYVTDWVNGWNGEGKGRIYRIFSPETAQAPLVKAVQKMLAAGFSERRVPELSGLLSHPDRRIRLEAQFELAKRKEIDALAGVAQGNDSLLARIHGLWGLGQIQEQGASEKIAKLLVSLTSDSEPEVRAQAAKLLGDHRIAAGADRLLKLLGDESPRARYFAALSLGKLRSSAAVLPLAELLAENADADPVLRHGAIMGLAGAPREELMAIADHPAPSVRAAVVVALRKGESPLVARFLSDQEERVALEAARAIYDLPIPEALPALAAVIERPMQDDALIRRVIAANYRLGTAETARALAIYAGRQDQPVDRRIDALKLLAQWSEPSSRDWVLGMWRPLEARDAAVAGEAVKVALPGILTADAKVRQQGIQTAAQLGIEEVQPALVSLLEDADQPGAVRADALAALAAVAKASFSKYNQAALESDDPVLRSRGLALLAERDVDAALPRLRKAVVSRSLHERQAALATLGSLKSPEADRMVLAAVQSLLEGAAPADTHLDILAAARTRKTPEIAMRLEQWKQQADKAGPLGPYLPSLAGGDAERGRRIFFENTTASCVRCHRVGSVGGAVGPELSRIAADKSREYLLESIAQPNAKIAKGFATTVLITIDGKVITGIVTAEDQDAVRLVTADGKLVVVDKADVDEREPGKSAMPADIVEKLSPRDLRDLVEYLSTLK